MAVVISLAFSRNQVNVAVLKNYSDSLKQERNPYSAVFHEFFHIQQVFTFTDPPSTNHRLQLTRGVR